MTGEIVGRVETAGARRAITKIGGADRDISSLDVNALARARISELEALCADAYAMIEHEPASDISKQNFLRRIRSTLGWKIQL